MVGGHVVELAAFLVEAEPPALAVLVVIFDAHVDRGGDAGEAENHEPYECPVAETQNGVRFDRIEERARLVGREDGRLAALHDVLRAADRACRVHFDHVADHEPVKEHPDRGQVLLYSGRRGRVLLDVCSDDDGLELVEFEDAVRLAPLKELPDRDGIGGSGVLVADIGDEELDEAPAGAFASTGNCRGQRLEAGSGQFAARRDRNEAGVHGLYVMILVGPPAWTSLIWISRILMRRYAAVSSATSSGMPSSVGLGRHGLDLPLSAFLWFGSGGSHMRELRIITSFMIRSSAVFSRVYMWTRSIAGR